MDLIPPAYAQTAEAAKIAVDAGNVLLQYQVLGAACIFLVLACGVLGWLLHRSWEGRLALTERVIATAEQSKTAADDNTEATKALTATVGALSTAVGALSREIEGEAREMRHAFGNLAQIVKGQSDALRDLRGLPRLPARRDDE